MFTIYDMFGLIIVGIGVFSFNVFKENPQKASMSDEK